MFITQLIKLMQGKLKTNMKTNSYFLLHTIKSFKDQSEDLNKFIQSWVDNVSILYFEETRT